MTVLSSKAISAKSSASSEDQLRKRKSSKKELKVKLLSDKQVEVHLETMYTRQCEEEAHSISTNTDEQEEIIPSKRSAIIQTDTLRD